MEYISKNSKNSDSDFETINNSNSIKNKNIISQIYYKKINVSLPRINSKKLKEKRSMSQIRNIKLSHNIKNNDFNTINNVSRGKIRIKLSKNSIGNIKSKNKYLINDSDIKNYVFNTQLKVPYYMKFHKDLMKENEKKQLKKTIESNMKLKEDKKEEEEEIKEKKDFNKKQSLSDYIKLRKEELIFNKEYHKQKMKEDVKNLIKNELKTAKKKLKINEKEDNNNLNVKPIWKKKLERYKCISYQNPLLQVNQPGNVQYVVKDGDLMYQLFQDGFELCNNKRYQIQY